MYGYRIRMADKLNYIDKLKSNLTRDKFKIDLLTCYELKPITYL